MTRGNGISPHDVRRLAVATGLDPRPVLKVIAGESVRRSTLLSVTRAARELGITLPQRETAAA
ncbi:MAG: hypothetical protein JWM10_2558 [Myxococcaceae bacterium]|nr:hypothetical protein [Myxococcaceae bacterium]